MESNESNTCCASLMVKVAYIIKTSQLTIRLHETLRIVAFFSRQLS